MDVEMKNKIFIIGGTGYLGKYMVKASVSLGHPTYVYVRPLNPDDSHSTKHQLLKEFKSAGVTVFEGEVDEHDKLVSIMRQVDVVISTIAVPEVLQQLKLINAVKEAGNIKRFVPSEFGNEADRINGLPPFEALLEKKKKIRRATEEAGLPFTYVSANSFAAYFVSLLLHPSQEKDNEITVYGTGETKAVLNYEEDIAIYTIKAATDPRVVNRLIICRPPKNVVSQLDLLSLWEKKTGRSFNKIHVPEQEMIKRSQILPVPDNISISILHNIFVKGDQTSFELGENDLEASQLYPEHKYTSIDQLLDIFMVNAPKIKLAALV